MIGRKQELELKLMFLEEDKEKLEEKDSSTWTGQQHREYVEINRQILEINRELKE
ncbi:hypothetical protein [Helcococcus kunzii]|uniref:hypothetical protein n=1 Tax=Helcococcus kunzii TaxID=40091 RepID=UPI001BB0C60B|nr:hypothetical protein [Helcococcus kunzii]QUY65099.1 hypothetical protein GUI37_06035 [Helcococcus kunzii]